MKRLLNTRMNQCILSTSFLYYRNVSLTAHGYIFCANIYKFKIFWNLNCRLRISLQLLPVKMKVIIRDGINKRRGLSLSTTI